MHPNTGDSSITEASQQTRNRSVYIFTGNEPLTAAQLIAHHLSRDNKMKELATAENMERRRQFLAKSEEEQEAIPKDMSEERRTKHFAFEDIIE